MYNIYIILIGRNFCVWWGGPVESGFAVYKIIVSNNFCHNKKSSKKEKGNFEILKNLKMVTGIRTAPYIKKEVGFEQYTREKVRF